MPIDREKISTNFSQVENNRLDYYILKAIDTTDFVYIVLSLVRLH